MSRFQKRVEYEGRVYGWWTVVKYLEHCPKTSNQIYLCRDIFGIERVISSRAFYCKGFGKYFKDKSSIAAYSLLLAIHKLMLRRCYNSNDKDYKNYGYRGISVCPEWRGKEGHRNYAKWAISAGWEKGLTVDRIDANGPYSPENCRIITRSENSRYKRTNKLSLSIADKIRADFKDKIGDTVDYCKVTAEMYKVTPYNIMLVLKNKIWVRNDNNCTLS